MEKLRLTIEILTKSMEQQGINIVSEEQRIRVAHRMGWINNATRDQLLDDHDKGVLCRLYDVSDPDHAIDLLKQELGVRPQVTGWHK